MHSTACGGDKSAAQPPSALHDDSTTQLKRMGFEKISALPIDAARLQLAFRDMRTGAYHAVNRISIAKSAARRAYSLSAIFGEAGGGSTSAPRPVLFDNFGNRADSLGLVLTENPLVDENRHLHSEPCQ